MTICWNGDCLRCCGNPNTTPIGAQLDLFLTGAAELGYAAGPSKGHDIARV
jgi:hypothetical protein